MSMSNKMLNIITNQHIIIKERLRREFTNIIKANCLNRVVRELCLKLFEQVTRRKQHL